LTSKRLSAVAIVGLLLVIAAPPARAEADAARNAEWHLGSLDIAHVQQISQGEGVTIAVIDTGVNGNHPDLTGTVLAGTDLVLGHADHGWEDTDGHGTAMASLIAAHGHGDDAGVLGIAPKAKILPIRVMAGGDHGTADIDAVGIDAAVKSGARVISISISDAESPAMSEAVARAQKADVVVVAAVGNAPENLHGVTFPARYDGVVAVGAVDRGGNHAEFSLTGRQLMISAPGVDIESAGVSNGYLVGTGTSASTAITAGVVALIRAKFPTLPATEVIHRLTATATDKGPKGRDDEYGYGIVNPYAALTAEVPPLAPSRSPTPSSTAQDQPPQTSRTGAIIAVITAAAGVLVVAVVILRCRRTRRT
jgi:type VII secretion-associated serine protease mycosin